MTTLGSSRHLELDDAFVDAVAARLVDTVAERVVAALREDGLGSEALNRHAQLTLADAHGSEELAIDALRDAFGAAETPRSPENAITWDLTR